MNDPQLIMDEIKDPALQKKSAAIKTLYDSFDRKDLPGGYAVAILNEGQVIFKQAYGMANHEYDAPFTSQTVFDFASVAKQFTGHCIADLIRKNQLSLEDNIRKFLPELPDYGQAITVRHLLGHTSGLRDWFTLVKLTGRNESDTVTDDFLMKLTCSQQALNFTPGSQHAYSNTGYFLLAQIIHRATGKTLQAYADENIFKPLGMESTFFSMDVNEIIKERAAPYLGDADNHYGQGANQLTAPGSSSLFSTLDDMVKWARYFDQCIAEEDESFRMMLTPTVLNDGKQIKYNFGIFHGRWRNHLFIGHGGSWNAFACEVFLFPAERISLIFITNRSPNHINTYDAVRCILFDEPEFKQDGTEQETVEDQEPPAVDQTELANLPGIYFSPEIQSAYTVRYENGQLILGHLINENVILSWVKPGTYKGDKYWCEQLIFTRNAENEVDGFYLSADAGNMVKDLRFIKLES